ncbi:MAG: LysR family transcriptional regulator [Betaproteobacteria bacterium]|nr:LysR family transcriptional regulator [Betaproteobacteria bacterium]
MLGPIFEPFYDTELEATRLFDDPLMVTVGSKNRWLRRRHLALSDLMNDAWILPPADTPIGVRCAEAFRTSGLDVPKSNVESVSVQLQNGLLATQRFITMFPGSLIHFSGRRFAIKALPIKLPLPPLQIGIITLRNRTISPAVQLFIKTATEVTRPLAKEK